MKTMKFLLAFCSIAYFTQAQTIDIVEETYSTVMPDVLRAEYTITTLHKKEREAMAELSIQVDNKLNELVKAGFSKDDIKLAEFSLDEKYNYDGKKTEKLGFEASQTVKIKIPVERKEMVARLMETLANNKDANLRVNVFSEFSRELEQKITTELITQALENATKKATLIASNLNVRVGGIKTVEYGELEYGRSRLRRVIRFVPPAIEVNEKVEKSSSWNTYGIMENDVSEKIHVIWNIQLE